MEINFKLPLLTSAGLNKIVYWDDFLTEKDIEFILNRPEWKSPKQATVGGPSNDHVNKNYRRCDLSYLDLEDDTEHIYQLFSSVIVRVNGEFFRYDLESLQERIQLTLYTELDQGMYAYHNDEILVPGNTVRKLSMSVLLDDPSSFEGGDLQVLHGSIEPVTLEQKRGRAWFFPSWMLHQVTPVTKGRRRAAVIWVAGPEFK